jgi:hypothetical protein
MAKVIYLEATMILLMNSMGFKTEEAMTTFREDTFLEEETMTGVIYYVEK